MKKILDTTIVAVEWLNTKNVLLTLTASQQMPDMLPGQFVEVRVDNEPDVFLRRPISIHFFDPQENLLYLMVQVVGKGTQRIATLKAGDVFNLILPLGNTFSIPENSQRLLLVGGGVGVAPLLYLGAELKKKGHVVTFLLGARTADDLLRMEAFQAYGKVYVTTEDASLGEKGFVTQHSLLQQQKPKRTSKRCNHGAAQSGGAFVSPQLQATSCRLSCLDIVLVRVSSSSQTKLSPIIGGSPHAAQVWGSKAQL